MRRSDRTVNRRRMMQLAALATGGFLAGCGGDGDGGDGNGTTAGTTEDEIGPGQDGTTEDGTSGGPTTTEEEPEDYEMVEGQEFLIPTTRAMEEVNFFQPDNAGVYWDYHHFTRDIPAYGPWVHSDYLGTGEIKPRMFENVVHEPGRFEMTVRDDANWSNGDPITGRDAIMGPVAQRVASGARPFGEVEDNGVNQPYDAITGYEHDGKTGVLLSDGDWFNDFVDTRYWLVFLIEYGPRWPTELDEYEEFSNALFEMFDQASSGEVNPWESDDADLRTDIKREVFGDDGERNDHHQTFRDADNVATSGAWRLREIQGDTNLILEPNPHHYNSDQINFDSVNLVYQGSDQGLWSGLNTGLYDMAQTAPPPNTAAEFSNKYERFFANDNNGMSLVCNGQQDVVEDPRVRQAMAAAIDQPPICSNYNPDTWEPLETPGPDYFANPPSVGQEWFDDNLQNYEQDLELAEELMGLAEADYERNSDGTWVDGDGEPAELVLNTTPGSLGWLELLIQQLNEFGFQAEAVPLENAIYTSELDDGQVQMWTGNPFAGSSFTAVTQWTYMAWHQNLMRRYGWYDGDIEEAISETEWQDGDPFIVRTAPDTTDHMTIQAPEVGDFYADNGLQEWSPVALAAELESASQGVIEDVWPQLIWIANWYMPAVPIAVTQKQFFLNTDNWVWNRDEPMWDHLGVTTRLTPRDMVGWGNQVFADPENTKS